MLAVGDHARLKHFVGQSKWLVGGDLNSKRAFHVHSSGVSGIVIHLFVFMGSQSAFFQQRLTLYRPVVGVIWHRDWQIAIVLASGAQQRYTLSHRQGC